MCNLTATLIQKMQINQNSNVKGKKSQAQKKEKKEFRKIKERKKERKKDSEKKAITKNK